MEKHYALLKDNRVMNIIVVEEQDDSAIQTFIDEQNFDEFIYLNDLEPMPMYSLRVNNEFIPPDYDYLKSIGLSNKDNAEYADWLKEQNESIAQ